MDHRSSLTTSIVLDIHPIGSPFDGWRILGIHTTGAVQFLPQGNDKTIKVLNVGLSVFSDGFLQTSIGLFGQSMGRCIGKDVFSAVRLALKGVPNAARMKRKDKILL